MEKLTEEESSLLISALNIIDVNARKSFATMITQTEYHEYYKRMEAEKELKERINTIKSIKNKLKQIQ